MSKKLDLVGIHLQSGYSSDLETSSSRNNSLASTNSNLGGIPSRQSSRGYSLDSVYNAVSNANTYAGMNAYQRHVKFINDYKLFYGAGNDIKFQPKVVTDQDILKQQHKFIRSDEDNDNTDWRKKLAKAYYDKLHKEYCITDLSRWKEGKFGLRWRIKKEVFYGKGQFICGNSNPDCTERDNLLTLEVPFKYIEQGERKNALVKIRLCKDCKKKMTFKKDEKKSKKRKRKEAKKKLKKSSKKQKIENTNQEINNKNNDTLIKDNEKLQKKLKKKLEKEKALKEFNDKEKIEKEKIEKELKEKEDSLKVWKENPIIENTKTKEDEFEAYFLDMFP